MVTQGCNWPQKVTRLKKDEEGCHAKWQDVTSSQRGLVYTFFLLLKIETNYMIGQYVRCLHDVS